MSGDEQSKPGGAPPILQRAAGAGTPDPRPVPAPTTAAPVRSAPRVGTAAAMAAGLPATGDLATEGPLRLLALAAGTQATGCLVIASGGHTHALWFKRGVVEGAASSRPEDDLAAFLVHKGLLTEEQARDARQLAAGSGGDLPSTLAELRLLDPSARFAELREHGAGLVRKALGVDAGTWRWEPGAPPPPLGFPLGSRWGMLTEAVRRMDAVTVRRRIGTRSSLSASRIGGRVDVADLMLNAQEARALALLDGVQSIDEIALAHPGDAEPLRRVALLLVEAELLTFGAVRLITGPRPGGAPPVAPRVAPPRAAPAPTAPPPAAPAPPAPAPAGTVAPEPTPVPTPPRPAAPASPRPPAAAPPAAPPPPTAGPPRPAPPPARPAPAAAPAAAPATPRRPAGAGGASGAAASPTGLEALRAMAARIQGVDHFQALGVPRDADVARIKAAYFQLARTWHPDAVPAGEPDEARRLRAEIFTRVAAAWGTLEDAARRAQYLEELKSGVSSQVDISRIYQAEQAFEKVAALAASRSWAEALQRVNEAIGFYPEEPEYAVWKAWLEFLLAPEGDRRAARTGAERTIETALRQSPKCAVAYLFLGRMAKLCGDAAAAERHWKRGLSEVADAEMERELRFLRR